MRAIAVVSILALAAFPAGSQQPPAQEPLSEETIRVDVDVVSLYCSVRDKQGRYVRDLNKEGFTVLEDGAKQEIRYFSRETDLPLTIGLLVDVSKSQENLIEVERRAASRFFSEVLRKKDLAFLISFGSEAELLQDLTGSPAILEKSLQELRLNAAVGGLHPGPVPTASKPRGTILYDAVYLAATEKLSQEVGRKVIVLITDGIDTGSRVSRDEAIRAAQKSDAIIYSIYYYDAGAYGYYGGGGDGDIKRMSEETGGRLFKVDRRNPLERIFSEIQEEVRSQYAIGYTPSNASRDGGYRKVEIRSGNKDHRVQARKGYYAGRS